MNYGWKNGYEEKERKKDGRGQKRSGEEERRVEEKRGEEVQRGDNRPLDGRKKNKCLERETKM